MSGQEKQLYEFGPFRLDPVKRRLLREGEPVPLTPKAFETLLLLVKQSGKTVGKDDLMRRVWPGAVVEENNLNQNITALRKCLGDSRQASQYIATIPGLGYRFVAEVKMVPVVEAEPDEDLRGQTPLAVEKSVGLVEDGRAEIANTAASGAEAAAHATAADVLPSSIESLPTPAPDESDYTPSKPKSMVMPLALLLIASTAYAFWAYQKSGRPHPPKEAASGIEVTALTRTGTTGRATISPDGSVAGRARAARPIGRDREHCRRGGDLCSHECAGQPRAKRLRGTRHRNHRRSSFHAAGAMAAQPPVLLYRRIADSARSLRVRYPASRPSTAHRQCRRCKYPLAYVHRCPRPRAIRA
jgi:DNA-binding winged helix-turn-helix (wHTH) protein